MSKVKCADDLSDIITARLDILTSGKVTTDDIKLSDAISRQVGKALTLSALRIAYRKHRMSGGDKIQTLESRRNNNRA